jgi:hypothetical protein
LILGTFFWSATPCASPPPRTSIFSNYSFWVHHLVNQDDRHILANAMALDFSVAWQCLSKRTIGFSSQIKPHVVYLDTFFRILCFRKTNFRMTYCRTDTLSNIFVADGANCLTCTLPNWHFVELMTCRNDILPKV